MIKKIVIIACIGLIFGCAKEEQKLVDDVFVDHIIEFEAQAKLRSIDLGSVLEELSVRLADIDADAVGQCITYVNGDKAIEINRATWNGLSDNQKELLVFHELGHCVLNRDHLNETDENGQCVSIMRESTRSCPISYNASSREEYLNELFK